jgi:hypothetical protein
MKDRHAAHPDERDQKDDGLPTNRHTDASASLAASVRTSPSGSAIAGNARREGTGKPLMLAGVFWRKLQNELEQYWNNGGASGSSGSKEKARICRPFL